MFQKMKVAVIGCGMISRVYLENLRKFDGVELIGCADILPERAKQRAEQFEIRQMTDEEVFADPTIGMVVNLTYPLAHYAVAKAALLAGKHVYTEKMMTETVAQADELLALAAEKHLFCGGAPDTFLGGSLQLARQILDSGMLGTPTMAQAFLSRSYHHERYHTATEKRFAFCRHGGIPFDMGAYYLTDLVFLLGGIRRVAGFAQIRDPDRRFCNPKSPLFGQEMRVESYNQLTGSLEFVGGTLGSFVMTSEGGAPGNRFVIHCTDGAINLGDPNDFENTVKIYNKAGQESVLTTGFGWREGNHRGIGVLEAVYALQSGRTPRCAGTLCRHVLEAARGLCENGVPHIMQTAAARPQPLKTGYTEYEELVFRAD